MIIREAGRDDFEGLLAVMRSAPWDKTQYLERTLERRNVVVAELDGHILAYVVWNLEFFSLPFIWLVTVLPEYRRKGLASKLIAWVEERCANQRLYSSTNRSNVAMQRLLEGRGYRRCGEVDVDPGDAEVFYHKTLSVNMGDDGLEPPTFAL
jgi:GNAT superfamily N-acetyltransferase